MLGLVFFSACATTPAPVDPVPAVAAPSTATDMTTPVVASDATGPTAPTASATAPVPAPAPAPEVSSAPPSAGPAAAPTGLRIPSLEMDEQLIDLGLTADGGAEVPQDYDRAGWYSPGGRPGAVGPTVLLGHVDSTTGPAVFYRLRELVIGDEVQVVTTDGVTARYAVSAVDDYGKDDFPTFAVFGATLDDVVRLVTCGGDFDRSVGSYRDNLVVTATRIG